MYRIVPAVFIFSVFFGLTSPAQETKPVKTFTHADTLRGSVGPGRSWWDVMRYDLAIIPDIPTRTIQGTNEITVRITRPGRSMQIDLQAPMQIDSIEWLKYSRTDAAVGTDKHSAGHPTARPGSGKTPIGSASPAPGAAGFTIERKKLAFRRDGNAWFADFPGAQPGSIQTIKVYFQGRPRQAMHAPWDGGWIWTKDKLGRPWISVACQGLGASSWYPCKDYQGDEPDSGASIQLIVPDTLVAVANGRCIVRPAPNERLESHLAFYMWQVQTPINNYTIVPSIGKYVTWHEDYPGEKGKLDCDYWVLDYDLEKAKIQFRQVPDMLRCFESWFGPYPFYEDGYKLVEAPHLGMEHQSAVAYGNGFVNGYSGKDLSGTGWGMKWDFIIVHESGHEWFGNSITTKDIADMWVHEGFTNYSETLFTTCQSGVQAGNEYVIGTRKLIRNDKPIIPNYGVNQEGSEDMYYKTANMIHAIRQIVADDSAFKQILRDMNRFFYHQTVTGAEIESWLSQATGKDLSKIFDQYLRTTKIPQLEYKQSGNTLSYHWTNCVKGFNMPVRIHWDVERWITPLEEWKTLKAAPGMGNPAAPDVDSNFYIRTKKLD